jgi:hypothetical protein
MRIGLLLLAGVISCGAESTFGTWVLDPSRSTFAGDSRPKVLSVRIEPHAKGEVFTVDRTEANGQVTNSSILLYFDGAARAFEDDGCVGTQSSRRLDQVTIEILRQCRGGNSIKVVRQLQRQGAEMVLEITEQRAEGRGFQRRLVLEKR